MTAAVGDTLRFTWAGGHDVVLMANEEALSTCDFADSTALGSASGVEHTLSTLPAYFACSVGPHCSSGQRLSVTAAAASPPPVGGAARLLGQFSAGGMLHVDSLAALEAGLRHVVALAAAAAPAGLRLLTLGAQQASPRGAMRITDAGLWGLSRAARQESMGSSLACTDWSLESQGGGGTVGVLAALEALAAAGELETAVCTDGRDVLAPRLARASVVPPHLSASAPSSHLLSGGTGALGQATAGWLAQRGATRLIFASRGGGSVSSGPAGLPSGSAALFVRCDVAQPREVERALALAADPPAAPLRGVWHAAGVLADGLLAQQGASGLRRVSASKSHGAALLHRAGSALPLQASVLFSSIAALFGGAGQANYSAANACLDGLASCRRAHGLAAASVQWGPWGEVGMATRGVASTRMAAMEEASGLGRISNTSGLATLHGLWVH